MSGVRIIKYTVCQRLWPSMFRYSVSICLLRIRYCHTNIAILWFLNAILKSFVLQESVNIFYFVNKQVKLFQNHKFSIQNQKVTILVSCITKCIGLTFSHLFLLLQTLFSKLQPLAGTYNIWHTLQIHLMFFAADTV